jgi:hypothetical protein
MLIIITNLQLNGALVVFYSVYSAMYVYHLSYVNKRRTISFVSGGLTIYKYES